jgi:hypothetical protein
MSQDRNPAAPPHPSASPRSPHLVCPRPQPASQVPIHQPADYLEVMGQPPSAVSRRFRHGYPAFNAAPGMEELHARLSAGGGASMSSGTAAAAAAEAHAPVKARAAAVVRAAQEQAVAKQQGPKKGGKARDLLSACLETVDPRRNAVAEAAEVASEAAAEAAALPPSRKLSKKQREREKEKEKEREKEKEKAKGKVKAREKERQQSTTAAAVAAAAVSAESKDLAESKDSARSKGTAEPMAPAPVPTAAAGAGPRSYPVRLSLDDGLPGGALALGAPVPSFGPTPFGRPGLRWMEGGHGFGYAPAIAQFPERRGGVHVELPSAPPAVLLAA